MLWQWLAPPDAVGALLFLVGWSAGWVGVLRARTLRTATSPRRDRVSVVVPCRDEARNLAELLPNLRSVLREGDEVVVVDDESSDDTIGVALAHGVTVVRCGPLPAGWAGKPHACWSGARRAVNDVLVFVDADVRLGDGAIDDLLSLLDESPDAVASAMPWHAAIGAVERLSMLFNAVSTMVGGTRDPRRRVAYGPFLAVRRSTYLAVGGHSNPAVRAAVVEDLALARAMPLAVARIARPDQVRYRMYPDGVGQLVEGWTKNTAIGAANTPRASALMIVAWIASLCGGPITSVWCYALSVLQVRLVARRAGDFGWGAAIVYPLHAAFFVVVAARSALRSAWTGSVSWRGRDVATR